MLALFVGRLQSEEIRVEILNFKSEFRLGQPIAARINVNVSKQNEKWLEDFESILDLPIKLYDAKAVGSNKNNSDFLEYNALLVFTKMQDYSNVARYKSKSWEYALFLPKVKIKDNKTNGLIIATQQLPPHTKYIFWILLSLLPILAVIIFLKKRKKIIPQNEKQRCLHAWKKCCDRQSVEQIYTIKNVLYEQYPELNKELSAIFEKINSFQYKKDLEGHELEATIQEIAKLGERM